MRGDQREFFKIVLMDFSTGPRLSSDRNRINGQRKNIPNFRKPDRRGARVENCSLDNIIFMPVNCGPELVRKYRPNEKKKYVYVYLMWM